MYSYVYYVTHLNFDTFNIYLIFEFLIYYNLKNGYIQCVQTIHCKLF